MLQRSDIDSAFLRGLHAMFLDYMDKKAFPDEEIAPLLHVINNSKTKEEKFSFPGDWPEMTEKKEGTGTERDPQLYDFSITALEYEAVLKIDRVTKEDDAYGLLKPYMQNAAGAAIRKARSLLAAKLYGGFADSGAPDGQHAFDVDHPTLSGTYSNDGAANNLSNTNFDTAYLAMSRVQSDQDSFRGTSPDTVVVEPYNFLLAKNLFLSDMMVPSSGAGAGTYPQSNVYKGLIKKIVSLPELTSTYQKYWFLFDTSKPSKALVLVIREAPNVESFYENRPRAYFVRPRMRIAMGWWDVAVAYGAQGA